MKKYFSSLLLLLAALALLVMVGCESETDTEDMRIILDKEVSRTIIPADLDLSITEYNITCVGPDNKTHVYNTRRSTFLLEGVPVGTWNITAEGCNESGTALVRGSTTFNLNKTNTSVTVVLNELIGQGALNLVYTWDGANVESPSVEVSIEDQNGNTYLSKRQLEISNSSATLSLSDLPAGSYIVHAILYDKGLKAAGYTEAVRIVDNKTTSGSLSFNVDALPSIVGQLTLENKAGTPIICTVRNLSSGDQIPAQENRTVSLDTSSFSSSDVSVSWYLDGSPVGNGTEVTICPNPGEHRLDVIASTRMLGATGSTSISFQAALLGERGVPVLASTIQGSTELKIGGRNTIEFLSDGNVLLTSDQTKTATICSIQRNELVAKTSISYEYPVMDAIQLNGCSKIALLYENVPIGGETRATSARFAYDSSAMTLTKEVEGQGLVRSTRSDIYLTKATGLIRNASWMNGNFGIFGYTNQPWNYIVLRSLTNTDTLINSAASYYTTGRVVHGSNSTISQYTLMNASQDGERMVFVNPDDGHITFCWNESNVYMSITESSLSQLEGATAVALLPSASGEAVRAAVAVGQTLYVFATDGESVTLVSTISRSSDEGSSTGTVKMFTSYDEKFLYFLNSGSSSISTWKIENSLPSFVGVTGTAFRPARAAISPSGAYMLCCGADSSTITMFRIKTE